MQRFPPNYAQILKDLGRQSLKEDIDFADVTLVCLDDLQITAHSVIMAASSDVEPQLLGHVQSL